MTIEEEEIDKLATDIVEEMMKPLKPLIDENKKLLSRIKELEEGIEKHKADKYGLCLIFDESVVKQYVSSHDKELYKLIQKGG